MFEYFNWYFTTYKRVNVFEKYAIIVKYAIIIKCSIKLLKQKNKYKIRRLSKISWVSFINCLIYMHEGTVY